MTNFKPWSLILAPYMYPRFPSVTIFKKKEKCNANHSVLFMFVMHYLIENSFLLILLTLDLLDNPILVLKSRNF